MEMGASMMGTGERIADMGRVHSNGQVVLLISENLGTIVDMVKDG